jgi:hypothetical protein
VIVCVRGMFAFYHGLSVWMFDAYVEFHVCCMCVW